MIKYLLYSFEGIYRKNVHFKDPVMIAIGYHLFPIPNTVVKPIHAESTWLETTWEVR